MSFMDNLAAKMNGKVWTTTGPDEGQCTAVPHQEQLDLGLGIVYGNAKDTYNNAPDSLYVKALNTATYVPPEGAIGVDVRGAYGHTWSILSGTNVNTQHLLEQNNPLGNPVRIATRDYTGVYGFFTPRAVLAPAIPTPTKTDSPSAANDGVVNGQGLHGHTEPHLNSPWPWYFDDNEHLTILARTVDGENVTDGPYAPSKIWYLVQGASSPKVWVSDAFLRTQNTPANVPDWSPAPTTPDPTPVSDYSPRPAQGLFGVDVSSVGQGRIDWDKLVNGDSSRKTEGAGIDFAVARAGHVGKTFGGDDNSKDPQFDFNRSEALRLNVPFGAYWFCYPSLDPKVEAQAFANVVSAVEDSETLWTDIETAPEDGDMDLIEWCKQFKTEVERLTNHRLRGYFNSDFNNRFPGLKEVFSDGIWAAQFDDNPALRPFDGAIMHQYTSSGKLPGITGKVDLNVFFGTKDELIGLGKPLSQVQPPIPNGNPSVDPTIGDKLDAQTDLLKKILVILQELVAKFASIFK
jgi:GH25 family lysozyme M1 (1,4-beta-N-acetylmuramidase)